MSENQNKLLAALLETKAQPTTWHTFMQLWPEVLEALEKGYTIRDVHSALVSKERWHGGYEGFRQFVARARGTAAHPAAQSSRKSPAPQHTHAPAAVQRHREYLKKNKGNPMLERLERDPYDYSGLSEEVKRLIGPAVDTDDDP